MKRYAGLTGNCKKLRIKSHSKKQNVVVVALVLVVGFQILASIQGTLVAGTTASNATITVQNAIDTNVVGNLGLIALIAVMSVVLFLIAGFATRR
jgi:hypothetical protein